MERQQSGRGTRGRVPGLSADRLALHRQRAPSRGRFLGAQPVVAVAQALENRAVRGRTRRRALPLPKQAG